MNKPDPHDASRYEVQPGEEVAIRVESVGVLPLVKASLDGATLPGPPFNFAVTLPAGGVHVVAAQCDFPPENPAQAKHVIHVRGSRGGLEYRVATIYPDTPVKRIVITFDVK